MFKKVFHIILFFISLLSFSIGISGIANIIYTLDYYYYSPSCWEVVITVAVTIFCFLLSFFLLKFLYKRYHQILQNKTVKKFMFYILLMLVFCIIFKIFFSIFPLGVRILSEPLRPI